MGLGVVFEGDGRMVMVWRVIGSRGGDKMGESDGVIIFFLFSLFD